MLHKLKIVSILFLQNQALNTEPVLRVNVINQEHYL